MARTDQGISRPPQQEPRKAAIMAKSRFETLMDLICKYDDVPKRDRDTALLNILIEQAAEQPCEESSVFIELFESTARSPYSKAKRLKALVRNGFDRHDKIDSV